MQLKNFHLHQNLDLVASYETNLAIYSESSFGHPHHDKCVLFFAGYEVKAYDDRGRNLDMEQDLVSCSPSVLSNSKILAQIKFQ